MVFKQEAGWRYQYMINLIILVVIAALVSVPVSLAGTEPASAFSRDDFRIVREIGRSTEFDSPGWIEFSRMSVEQQLSVVATALQYLDVPSAVNTRRHREMTSERRHLREQLSAANREIDRLRTDYNRLRAWREDPQIRERNLFAEYFNTYNQNEDFLELLYEFYSNEIDIGVFLSATTMNCILDNIGDPRTDYAVSVMIAACTSEAISEESRLTYVETLRRDLEDAENRRRQAVGESLDLQHRLDTAIETIDDLQSQVEQRNTEIESLFDEIERLHQISVNDQPPIDD